MILRDYSWTSRRGHVRGSYRPTIRRTLAPLRGALERALLERDVPAGAQVARLPDGAAPGTWGQWLCVDCPDTTDNRPCDHCRGERCVLGLRCSGCGAEDTCSPDLLGERCGTCKRGTWEPDWDCEVPR